METSKVIIESAGIIVASEVCTFPQNNSFFLLPYYISLEALDLTFIASPPDFSSLGYDNML